jgi:hypothetical protein
LRGFAPKLWPSALAQDIFNEVRNPLFCGVGIATLERRTLKVGPI